MSDNQETINVDLQTWLNAERWFMRYSGGASIIIGLISLFSGILDNPDKEIVVTVLNLSVALGLIIAGIWLLWLSSNEKRLTDMIDKLLIQSANRPMILAVIQIITSILFLLEGFRGRLPMLLLGILLLSSAVWFIWRSMQIRRFQNVA